MKLSLRTEHQQLCSICGDSINPWASYARKGKITVAHCCDCRICKFCICWDMCYGGLIKEALDDPQIAQDLQEDFAFRICEKFEVDPIWIDQEEKDDDEE